MVKEINEQEFNDYVLTSTKPVLVDFYASWCGPCRMLAPIMEEISNEVDVYKVNVDMEQNLAIKYGVMSIPCVICFKDGNEIKRSVGLKQKEDILNLAK